ncbi:MAG: hypothetical protein AAFV53_00360 [Myxococcota bacterium]
MTSHVVMSPYPDCRSCAHLRSAPGRTPEGPVAAGGCQKIIFIDTAWLKFLDDKHFHKAMNAAQAAERYREGRYPHCPESSALKAHATPQQRARARQEHREQFAEMLGSPFDEEAIR